MENVAGEQHLIILKLQTVIKSYSLMMGASNFLIFSTCFFHFWHLLSYKPITLCKVGHMMAKLQRAN